MCVSDLETQPDASRRKTLDMKARNDKLGSEVRDLKEGTGAVEERARYELGKIKQNEIFVQVLRKDEQPKVSMTPLPVPPPVKSDKKPKP